MKTFNDINDRVRRASTILQNYQPVEEDGGKCKRALSEAVETLLACEAVLVAQSRQISAMNQDNFKLGEEILNLKADLAVEKRRLCVALGVAGTGFGEQKP